MAFDSYYNALSVLGKRGLNTLYPNEFEIYIFALELVDASGKTVDYFLFPINPSGFSEDDNPLTSINKTAGGINIHKTDTFVPIAISLQGNFGRQLKFVSGNELISFSAALLNHPASTLRDRIAGNFQQQTFSKVLKTGYGCCKVLERMCDLSSQLDQDGNPYSLFFYNLALGNSYLVEVTHFRFSQDMSSNMIWNYALGMTAVGYANDVTNSSQQEYTALFSSRNVVQGTANRILGQIRQTLLQ
jgi:hypothetical protein